MAHVLAVVFAVGFPVISTPTYALRRTAMLAGDHRVKRREYLETITWLSAMGIASLTYFVASGLELSLLGVAVPRSGWGWVALSISGIGSAVLWLQLRAVRTDPEMLAAAREALMPVREYFPSGLEERRLFHVLSFSAGIGEELFYRGFLLWYLGAWLPTWGAVAVSSMLFGLAHIMHGSQATIRSTVTGFALAGLYLLGGSLLAPMVLHTAVDLTSGETGSIAFGDEPPVAT